MALRSQKFSAFLKRNGRSKSAIKGALKFVSEYETFLIENGVDLDGATEDDLEAFVEHVEQEPKSSAKLHLWAIRYYYEYSGNEALCDLAGFLREERIQRQPFALKDFRGVNPEYIKGLSAVGIKNVDEMLANGATPEKRQSLAERTGIPPESILEFVKLSDLARIPGIKSVRARLYVDAGIDSIEKLADMEPEDLRSAVVDFIERTGFDGIPTLPKEARSAVKKAQRLPKIIRYGR
jgi:hypothetical protein